MGSIIASLIAGEDRWTTTGLLAHGSGDGGGWVKPASPPFLTAMAIKEEPRSRVHGAVMA